MHLLSLAVLILIGVLARLPPHVIFPWAPVQKHAARAPPQSHERQKDTNVPFRTPLHPRSSPGESESSQGKVLGVLVHHGGTLFSLLPALLPFFLVKLTYRGLCVTSPLGYLHSCQALLRA